jgi:uncharacterized protein (TIGR03086 family)
MSENSDKYRRAVDGFSRVVDATPGDAWSAPSPCEEWTARDVLAHVVGGMHRVAGADGAAPSVDDDPAGAYAKARDAALGSLTDERLATNVQSPMGDMPLDQLLQRFMTPDTLVHTWDLARAARVDVTLDPQLVEETYQAMLPLDDMIRSAGVFGPKVEPPAEADMQIRLMCFTGRRV